MHLLPRRWHDETWICSLRGHVAPAATVRFLGPDDVALGSEMHDGTRTVRCLRCDLWLRLATPDPAQVTADRLPPLDQLVMPLRGEALRQRLVLRAIAVERALHVGLFALAGVVALVARLELGVLQIWAQDLLGDLQNAVDNTARAGGHSWIQSGLNDVAGLTPGALTGVVLASFAYALVEGVEAVGLWRGRRWAEYLTVVVTASLLPFELRELAEGVSAFRLISLALNLAILVWLVWNKRLFGLRGRPDHTAEHTDWAEVLANPLTADGQARLEQGPTRLTEDRLTEDRLTEEDRSAQDQSP